MKPTVYWHDNAWWAELAHPSWTDITPFDTWEDAIDHALWLGWRAMAGRSLSG